MSVVSTNLQSIFVLSDGGGGLIGVARRRLLPGGDPVEALPLRVEVAQNRVQLIGVGDS